MSDSCGVLHQKENENQSWPIVIPGIGWPNFPMWKEDNDKWLVYHENQSSLNVEWDDKKMFQNLTEESQSKKQTSTVHTIMGCFISFLTLIKFYRLSKIQINIKSRQR